MAKDPAFLFFPGDWLGGTMLLTRHQKGCYIDLLMAQFNEGPLTLDQIKLVLGQDQAVWTVLQNKFKNDNCGRFYNEKLATEIEKRKAYVNSRSNNRSGRKKTYEQSYENHMNNHMENGNENRDKDEKVGGVGEEKTDPPKVDFKSVVDLFHRCCPTFPKVTKLSNGRKDKIRVRLGEMSGDMGVVESVFTKMAASSFLNGDNGRGWKASFDWVMENDKNWLKVYEGVYDKGKSTTGESGSGKVQGSFGEKVYTGTL